jgi:hypothetical protein
MNEDFLQGENLRSLIGRRRRLCTVLFLKTSFLKKLEFWCCLGDVRVAFFWLCVFVLLLGHCVISEIGCNEYFLNINIYYL